MSARSLASELGFRPVGNVCSLGADTKATGARGYAYPRYQFSNRSDDIRTLFTDTCDLVGVQWRPWGRCHISVARRESVAQLDSFIGPKC